MFVNQVNEEGRPICMCGEPVQPNDTLPEGSPERGGLVMGSKGMVILHNKCIDEHNLMVNLGLV